MADANERAQTRSRTGPLSVLIAGAGVAGLEAAFALRELAGGLVNLTLLAPSEKFVYRPMAVGEPFNSAWAQRYPLAALATDAGAGLVRAALNEVDVDRRVARTNAGTELSYDALVIGLGATLHPRYEHATLVDDTRMDELLHGLVQDVEGGYVKRLAFVIPAPVAWPLPAYELALMTAERAWDMQVDLAITILTPEVAPLAVFGQTASRAVSRLLAEREIDVVTSAYCEIPAANTIRVGPGDTTLEVDRIVALPELRGPAILGLPHDSAGFLPVDAHGRVRGVASVWAAGDATDFPVKHGGIAAQQADAAAESIAALAGAPVEPRPFEPVIEGLLLTGGRPRYLHASITGGHGDESGLTTVAAGPRPPKIAARYLAPRLEELAQSRGWST